MSNNLTVQEFLDRYFCGSYIKGVSAYDGKVLFTVKKGKRFDKYKNCEISAVYSEINAGKMSGYTQVAVPVTCISVVDYWARIGVNK